MATQQNPNTGNRSTQPQQPQGGKKQGSSEKQYAEAPPDDSRKYGEMGGTGRPNQGGSGQRPGQSGDTSSNKTRSTGPSDTQRPSREDQPTESRPTDRNDDKTTKRQGETGYRPVPGARKSK